MRKVPLFLIALGAAIFALSAIEDGHAAGFTVTTTADLEDIAPGDGQCEALGGECSLRAAIEEANELPGADSVDVPAGTYFVSLGLGISDDLSLQGAGADATIISIEGDDIIHSFGIKIVDSTTFISDLSVRDSYGLGGIWVGNSGVATLERLWLTENEAFSGGGVVNEGTVTIVDTTISDNFANDGGGVANLSSGSELTIINSTISNNTGTYAGVYTNGTSTIINSTIANNFGKGHRQIGLGHALVNSVVANNTTGDCFGGSPTDLGHNADSDGSCGFSGISGVDPQLSQLANHGGPTLTRLPLQTSPLLDAADNDNCPAADQRGTTRPYDGDHDGLPVCDIGAVERAASDESVGGSVNLLIGSRPSDTTQWPLIGAIGALTSLLLLLTGLSLRRPLT